MDLEWVVGLRALVLREILWPHSWFPLNKLEQKLHVCPVKFPSVCWESKCWNDSSRLQSPLVRFFSERVGLGSTVCGWRKVTVIYNEETPELLIQPWQPRGNCTRKDDILHIKYILHCVHPKSIQSCSTLCDPTDRSPPGSSVHGILQARVLEWVAILFSRGSSRPKDWSRVCSVSCVHKFFTTSAAWEALHSAQSQLSCFLSLILVNAPSAKMPSQISHWLCMLFTCLEASTARSHQLILLPCLPPPPAHPLPTPGPGSIPKPLHSLVFTPFCCTRGTKVWHWSNPAFQLICPSGNGWSLKGAVRGKADQPHFPSRQRTLFHSLTVFPQGSWWLRPRDPSRSPCLRKWNGQCNRCVLPPWRLQRASVWVPLCSLLSCEPG